MPPASRGPQPLIGSLIWLSERINAAGGRIRKKAHPITDIRMIGDPEPSTKIGVSLSGGGVRLGIDAPKGMEIVREELLRAVEPKAVVDR